MVESERATRDCLAIAIATDAAVASVSSSAGHDVDDEPEVDAVLYSIHTPGADVTDTTRRLVQRFPQARIVVLAAYVDARFGHAMTNAGAHAVFPTSSPLDRVITALLTPHQSDDALIEHSTARDHAAVVRAGHLSVTPRQHQVLRHLAAGSTPDQTARALGIQLDTCRDHIKSLRRALDVTNTVELVVVAAHAGLLPELSRPLP